MTDTMRRVEYRDCGRLTTILMSKETGQPTEGRHRVTMVQRVIGDLTTPEDTLIDVIELRDAATTIFDECVSGLVADHYVPRAVRRLATVGSEGLALQVAIDDTVRQ